MIDIARIALNLEETADGLWVCPRSGEVSFPRGAHETCRQLEGASFWFRHRNRCLVEAVRRFPPRGTLLDVGGGNGYVTLALRRAGLDAVLLEPSPDGTRHALARGLRPVIRATLEGAGFRPQSLPAVGLFDVLEHIADDTGFLRKVRGLLARGGRVYLTVPAYELLWSDADMFAGHHRRYTLGRLSERLRSAGLVPEYATYLFWPLPAPTCLFRALPSRLGLWRRTRRSVTRHHGLGSGRVVSLLERLLAGEPERIRRGWPIRFGGSCLVVAAAGRSAPRRLA